MKEIKTANYIKLCDNPYTLEMEDEEADRWQQNDRRRRNVDIGGGGSFKRRVQQQERPYSVKKNMTTKEWQSWFLNRIKEQKEKEDETNRKFLQKIKEISYAKSKKIVIEAKNKK